MQSKKRGSKIMTDKPLTAKQRNELNQTETLSTLDAVIFLVIAGICAVILGVWLCQV